MKKLILLFAMMLLTIAVVSATCPDGQCHDMQTEVHNYIFSNSNDIPQFLYGWDSFGDVTITTGDMILTGGILNLEDCGSKGNAGLKIGDNSYIYDDDCGGAPGNTLHIESDDSITLISNYHNGVYVKTNGNVGIGTDAPTKQLDVAGTMEADTICLSGDSCITEWPDDGGSGSDSDWTISGSNIYRSNGYVGVGTSSPSATLHVLAGATGTTPVLNVINAISYNYYSAKFYGKVLINGSTRIDGDLVVDDSVSSNKVYANNICYGDGSNCYDWNENYGIYVDESDSTKLCWPSSEGCSVSTSTCSITDEGHNYYSQDVCLLNTNVQDQTCNTYCQSLTACEGDMPQYDNCGGTPGSVSFSSGESDGCDNTYDLLHCKCSVTSTSYNKEVSSSYVCVTGNNN